MTYVPDEHPAGTAADRVAGAVEPCLDARPVPAVGDEQIPTVQQQQVNYSHKVTHQHLSCLLFHITGYIIYIMSYTQHSIS